MLKQHAKIQIEVPHMYETSGIHLTFISKPV